MPLMPWYVNILGSVICCFAQWFCPAGWNITYLPTWGDISPNIINKYCGPSYRTFLLIRIDIISHLHIHMGYKMPPFTRTSRNFIVSLFGSGLENPQSQTFSWTFLFFFSRNYVTFKPFRDSHKSRAQKTTPNFLTEFPIHPQNGHLKKENTSIYKYKPPIFWAPFC